MSGSSILILLVVILGVVFGLGLYFLLRKIEQAERNVEVDNALRGTIGPYAEIRRALSSSTPQIYSRNEMLLTPTNVVTLVRGFEAEVNNGGIDQFIFNSSGDYIHETIEALDMIGAEDMANILKQACQHFPRGIPPTDIFIRRKIMLSEVSPNGEAFEELDKLFFANEDQLYDLLEHYERDHSIRDS